MVDELGATREERRDNLKAAIEMSFWTRFLNKVYNALS
jgi:hypothetical protein